MIEKVVMIENESFPESEKNDDLDFFTDGLRINEITRMYERYDKIFEHNESKRIYRKKLFFIHQFSKMNLYCFIIDKNQRKNNNSQQFFIQKYKIYFSTN